VAGAPRVQNRVAGATRSEELIARAKETLLDDGTPFWHALFNLGEDLPDGVPLEIAQSAMFHQEPRNDPSVVLEITPRLGAEVVKLSESVHGRDSFAMDSRVELPLEPARRKWPYFRLALTAREVVANHRPRACTCGIRDVWQTTTVTDARLTSTLENSYSEPG